MPTLLCCKGIPGGDRPLAACEARWCAADVAERNIIVVGASAGGVEALMQLCAGLPGDLAAAMFVVQHLSPDSESALPKLLNRAGGMPAASAVDGEAVRLGHIYVAPPDRHLLLRSERILLSRGPQENRTRPAIDALFRSAAVAYGSRVVGVVLTGLLDDGTEGLIAIKKAGGTSVVQDPADASWPSMPANALLRDHVDHCLPLAELPALLTTLSQETAGPNLKLPPEIIVEDQIAAREFAVMKKELSPPGHPSPLSCPQCGGVLNEIAEQDGIRFRCQIGHAFTSLGLEAAQNDEIERALAIAVRTHRDRLHLFLRMEAGARERGLVHAAARWERAAVESRRLAGVLENAMEALRKSLPPAA